MSARAAKYAQLSSTIRALRSRTLFVDRYDRLLRTGGYNEVISVIRDLKGETLDSEFDVAPVERILAEDLTLAVRKLISYSPPETATLLRRYVTLFELQAVKVIARAILEESPPEDVEQLVIPVGIYSAAKARDIIESRSISRLIDSIREETLRRDLATAAGAGETFLIDPVIDRFAYQNIWAASSLPDPADSESVRRIIGEAIDFANASTVARLLYLGAKADQIRRLVIPVNFGLGPSLNEAIEGGSVSSSLRAIAKSPYEPVVGPIANSYREGEPLSGFDLQLRRSHAKTCRSAFAGFPFAAGLALAFLYLKWYELNDLFVIINGKRDDVPNDGIVNSLILSV